MVPHHVGYMVKNIDKAAEEFVQLGYDREGEIIHDIYRDVDICFLRYGGFRVELVKPSSTQSVVYTLSKKLGAMPYHICYQVDDVENEGCFLRERGYLPMGESMPAPAINNVPAMFFYHKQLGIVELIGSVDAGKER